MNKKMFKMFIDLNYGKKVKRSDEELDVLCDDFNIYLKRLSKESYSNTIPDSIENVINNLRNPRRRKGFPPSLFLHFSAFLKECAIKVES